MMVWSVMVLLTVAMLALVAWRLRVALRGHDPTVESAQLEVFRDRVRELEAERIAGSLDDAKYTEARVELEHAAALGLDPEDVAAGPVQGTATALVIVASVMVVVVAWGLYLHLGTPTAPPPMVAGSEGLQLEQLVAQLAARMEAQPDDVNGWMLLGRTRMVMGDFPGAVTALENAYHLAPEDADVLANYGEALVQASGDILAMDAQQMIEAALARDPTQPKGLWYGGLMAEQRGERELADQRWRALLAQDPPDALRAILVERLGMTPVPMGFHLRVGVSLAPGLDHSGSTLFVTVHDPSAPMGPPLAAVRQRADALPVQVIVDDSALMLPGTTLAGRAALRVVARVSATGSAERQPGDVYGESTWESGMERDLQVIINRRVE